ncbi:MAG: pitrilysin family protein [Candidatus Veblenbacteria bacterium]|nr:pitrilysin family protein [Candidatus Veblenbacteria bacterium]
MSTTKFHRLPNGLPVLAVPMPGTDSATVLALVHIGSRHENVTEKGLSHVLEHMLFKGTQKWPTAKELSQTLDGVGADYNAFTSKEHTGYYVKVASQHLPLAIDVVADMVWQPRLDGAELGREKKVICEEIKMYEDNPIMHIGDLLEGAVFQGSSLGVNIAGSQRSVVALRRAQVAGYHRRHYAPKRMLLVVAGKISTATQRFIQMRFNERRPTAALREAPFVARQRTPRVAIQKKDTQQVQLALGFPSYGWRDKRFLALELLATVLGGNMSSRLFLRLREREGLCYSIQALADQYQGTGIFAVQAGLDRARLEQAIRLIREELERVVREPIRQEELKKAKEYIKGKLTLALEDSSARASWVAKEFMFEHSREAPHEFMARLERVPAHALQKAAADILKLNQASLALIGPFSSAAPWHKLLA